MAFVSLLLQFCLLLPAASAQEIIESFIASSTREAPRQSEGDVTVLKDGTLLAAWSDFYGGSEDNAAARISAAKSTDGGRTWGPRYTLQENTGKANVMSVSFVRSRISGDLLLFHLRKNSLTDLKVYLRRSTDDGATFGEPVLVTPEEGYHVMNNARVIQLESGRLLAPISTTSQVWTKNDNFRTVVYFSDDDGRTWKRSQTLLSAPKRGAMEPGLIECKDGSVLQIIRTQTGRIWHSYSKDRGETWSEAAPWTIEAPESPSTLVRLPDTNEWLLVWNPNVEWKDPEKTVLGANHGGRRTPLVGAISSDEGKTWSKPREIETDPKVTYAYTSITPHGDRVLLSYYYFPIGSKDLSLRFKSIPRAWFTSASQAGAPALKVEPKPERLAIMRDGQHVADYVFSDEKTLRPHFRNVQAIPGVQVTRQHPPVPGVDAMDHDTMHPGIWLGFGDINGEDFWRNKARIEHVRFAGPVEAKDGVVTFVDESRLVSATGAPMGTLTSRIRLTARTDGLTMNWDATINAGEMDLVFGNQEEMGFGARVATPLAEKSGRGGLVKTSNGDVGAKLAWGKQAAWCSYGGLLDGKHTGIAILPDPANPHPTWWHTRDYGVFVANPFGARAGSAGGTLTLPKGQNLQLRFAAVLYASGQEMDVGKLFKEGS